MAVLKHLSSKSADYAKALEYLMFQHDERTQKPILDEKGQMILRDEYYLDGLNCHPFSFDQECARLNAYYHKNQRFDEIKTHHYILSFDPRDKDESGLTGKRAQELGLEFANRFFAGHQALVCTHMDGHNGSGNIHVHIVINSLRKMDVERQEFMERLCDSRAGYKHNQTKELLRAMQKGLMEITEREHLHQVDLISPAPVKISEREYWKNRREQEKLEELNARIIADGMKPRFTKYQTQKQFIRDAVLDISQNAKSLEVFRDALLKKHGIKMKTSRGRFSYLHPDREKYISARQLGALFDQESLLAVFEENKRADHHRLEEASSHAVQHLMPREKTVHTEQAPGFDSSHDYKSDPISILYIRSNLRLVVDLQANIKAQQNAAYAQKVKLSNLKEMARTVVYVQEHGYDTREDLEAALQKISGKLSDARKTLRSTEDRIKVLNEQVRFVGMYYANKSAKAEFLKSSNKAKYRKEHLSELESYEAGVKYIKEHFGGTVPSLIELKADRDQHLQMKAAQAKTYQYFKDYQKELSIACSNVGSILGKERFRNQSKDTSRDLI